MSAKPVVIQFVPTGLDAVDQALKSVSAAMADMERRAIASANNEAKARAAAAKEGAAAAKAAAKESADAEKAAAKERVAADKRAAKERADVEKFVAKAQESSAKEAFKAREKNLARHTKDYEAIKQRHQKEALAKEKAKPESSMLDKGGAVVAGGVIAGVMGAAALLKGALDIVTGALSQFGAYVLNDVIKPQLALGTKSMQIGNNLGVGRKAIRKDINELDTKYGGIDSGVIADVFATASENTKDYEQSKEVANLALKASQSMGFDPKQVAEVLGQQRRAMPKLSSKEFEESSTLFLRRFSDDKRFNLKMGQVGAIGGLLEGMTDQVGGDDKTKVATRLGLTSLIGQASLKMKEGAGEGLAGVFKDIMDPVKGAGIGGTHIADDGAKYVNQSLDSTIGALTTKFGGNLQKMQAAGYSEPTVKFLQALGVDRTFATAEKTKTGSGQQAVIDQIRGIMALNPYGEDKKTFDAEYAKSQEDAAIKLEETFKRLKIAIADSVMPVIENQLIPAFTAIKPELENTAKSFGKMLEDLKGVDLVGVFKAIAQGLGQAMYHLLALADKTIPGFNVDKNSLETLRLATGANKTETTAANVAGAAGESYFGRLFTKEAWTTGGGIAKTGAQLATAGFMAPVNALMAGGTLIKKAFGGTDVGAVSEGESSEPTRDTAALKAKFDSEKLTEALQENTKAQRERAAQQAEQGWPSASTSGAPIIARRPIP